MQNFLIFFTILFVRCKCFRQLGDLNVVDDGKRFPFFAQLKLPVYNEPNKTTECGGSLIHAEWILTAGSCFTQDKEQLTWMLNQNIVMVFMGSIKAYNYDFGERNTFKAVHHHPQYKPIEDTTVAEYNVAIGRLKTPFGITPILQIIRLSKTFNVCHRAIVIGAEGKNGTSRRIRYAEKDIKSAEELHYQFYKTPNTFYTESTLDRENLYNKEYPVNDIGGPIFCKMVSRYVQIGILASRIETFSSKGPLDIGIYEKIDAHLDFIFSYVPDVNYVRAINGGGYSNAKNVYIFCIFLTFVR